MGWLTIGLAISCMTAWACAAWSPVHSVHRPASTAGGAYPAQIQSPDGQWGWFEIKRGPGYLQWESLIAHGAEGEFVYFKGSVGHHMQAGLPMRCLASSVQAYHAPDDSMPVRWDLPARVILDRGLQTDDLPAWVHAKSSRRLPIRPIPLGLAVNTILWSAIACALARLIGAVIWPAHTGDDTDNSPSGR